MSAIRRWLTWVFKERPRFAFWTSVVVVALGTPFVVLSFVTGNVTVNTWLWLAVTVLYALTLAGGIAQKGWRRRDA